MAKKNNGKPKDDYPSKWLFVNSLLDFENHMLVKTANVKQNRFSVIYTRRAVAELSGSSRVKPAEEPVESSHIHINCMPSDLSPRADAVEYVHPEAPVEEAMERA